MNAKIFHVKYRLSTIKGILEAVIDFNDGATTVMFKTEGHAKDFNTIYHTQIFYIENGYSVSEWILEVTRRTILNDEYIEKIVDLFERKRIKMKQDENDKTHSE